MRIRQLHNYTTHPIPAQHLQLGLLNSGLPCSSFTLGQIVQVLKGCPLSLFIPPSFSESRKKKKDNRDLVSHPRSVKSLVPPLAPEQCLPYSLPCTLTMGLGFSDPGRPPTEEREENNAPRPDVGGLMLKPRSCPVSEPR